MINSKQKTFLIALGMIAGLFATSSFAMSNMTITISNRTTDNVGLEFNNAQKGNWHGCGKGDLNNQTVWLAPNQSCDVSLTHTNGKSLGYFKVGHGLGTQDCYVTFQAVAGPEAMPLPGYGLYNDAHDPHATNCAAKIHESGSGWQPISEHHFSITYNP